MWQNLSSREKVMLAVLGIVILLAGFYHFMLRPQLEAYVTVTGQLGAKRDKLREAELALRTKEAEIKKAAAVREQLDEYKPLFNTEFRQGSAMVLIGLKAAALQVNVISLEPAGVVDRESYLVLPVKLGLKGDYARVRELLKEIEKLPNLAEIRTLDIKPSNAGRNAPGGEPPVPVKVLCACELLIYTDPAPGGRLYQAREKITGWRVGRPDPFTVPERAAPHPGVSLLPPAPEGGDSQKDPPLQSEMSSTVLSAEEGKKTP